MIEWKLCSEELPEEGYYIVTIENTFHNKPSTYLIEFADFCYGEWWVENGYSESQNVIAWAELPEPYIPKGAE